MPSKVLDGFDAIDGSDGFDGFEVVSYMYSHTLIFFVGA